MQRLRSLSFFQAAKTQQFEKKIVPYITDNLTTIKERWSHNYEIMHSYSDANHDFGMEYFVTFYDVLKEKYLLVSDKI